VSGAITALFPECDISIAGADGQDIEPCPPGSFSKDGYGRRHPDVIMPKILVEGEQRQFRTLLSESLWFYGHRIESVADAAALWEHLGHTQPDLVLFDANSDEFGAMRLYQDLKQKF